MLGRLQSFGVKVCKFQDKATSIGIYIKEFPSPVGVKVCKSLEYHLEDFDWMFPSPVGVKVCK